MEKGKIKNNLLKILTMGIVSATLLTSTACAAETNENNVINDNFGRRIIAEDAFIVIDDIDGAVLHKGDAEQLFMHVQYSGFGVITELHFDCGESVATPSDYKIYSNEETAKKHSTKVCEECFDLN